MERLGEFIEKHRLKVGISLVVLILVGGLVLIYKLNHKDQAAAQTSGSDLKTAQDRIDQLEKEVSDLKAAQTTTSQPQIQTTSSQTTTAPDASGKVAGVATTSGLVNINTANVSELDSLPGIGPVYAQRIIDYRTANGPFNSIDQLDNVKGIGPAIIEKLRSKATL